MQDRILNLISQTFAYFAVHGTDMTIKEVATNLNTQTPKNLENEVKNDCNTWTNIHTNSLLFYLANKGLNYDSIRTRIHAWHISRNINP